jgi:hypothetical protein
MPDFLQDPWDDDPATHAALAWSECSLKKFFLLLEAQFAQIQAADQERFATFRAAQVATTAADEVVATAAVPIAAGPTAAVAAGGGGRELPKRGLRRAGGAPAAPPTPAPAAPTVQPTAPSTDTPTPATVGGEPTIDTATSALRQQLDTSLAAAGETSAPAPPAPPAAAAPPAVPASTTGGRLRRIARPPTT